MFELPMLMFRMTGIDSLIELNMDEVWGFPDLTSYGGGYSAKGILSIKACNYYAKDTHYFTTGELYYFARELRKCYTSLSGVATLHNTERELDLVCSFNKFGHVIITGKFQAAPDAKNILQFEIKSDQTQVKETIIQLSKVSDLFGDEYGIKKS